MNSTPDPDPWYPRPSRPSLPALELAQLPNAREGLEQTIPASDRLLSDDLPQSSPEEWDEGACLRETSLVSFPAPSAQALRLLSSELYGLYVEKGPGAKCEPTPRSQLEAVELDLRHTARFLALIAREALRVFVSGKKDIRRGRLADRLAVKVESIADEIAAEVRPKRKTGPQLRKRDQA